jgi:hypothetical protein
MLYKILVLSVGLLGSTAIGSAFAEKNGTNFVPEEKGQAKGHVAARVAALNKNGVGRNISSKPQTGRLQAQQPLQRPSPTIIRPQQNKQPQFVGSPRQPVKGIPPQVAARTDQKRPLPTPTVKAFTPQPNFQTRQQFTPPKIGLADSRQLKGGKTEQNLLRRALPTPPVKALTPQPAVSPDGQNLPTQTIPSRRALPIPPISPLTKGTTVSSWRPVQAAATSDRRSVGKPFQKLNIHREQFKPSGNQLHKLTANLEPTISRANGRKFNTSRFVEDTFEGIKFSLLKTTKGLEGWSQDTQTLELAGRELTRPPTGLKQFQNLEILFLNSNNLKTLSRDMMKELKNLEGLSIANNKLKSVDGEIGELQELRALILSENELIEIPDEVSSLPNLEWLLLDHNKLTHLPDEIGNLDQLKILNLSNNQLVDLPDSFKNLRALKGLSLEKNPNLKNLTGALSKLPNLAYLSVDYNVKLPLSLLQREKAGNLKINRL